MHDRQNAAWTSPIQADEGLAAHGRNEGKAAPKSTKDAKNQQSSTRPLTDEKIFPVKLHHNNQNDRQLLPNGSLKSFVTISISIGLFTEPEIVFRSHFPASVMSEQESLKMARLCSFLLTKVSR